MPRISLALVLLSASLSLAACGQYAGSGGGVATAGVAPVGGDASNTTQTQPWRAADARDDARSSSHEHTTRELARNTRDGVLTCRQCR